MHWRIDDVEVFLTKDDILVDHCLLDSLQVIPVHLTTDNLDQVFVALELHIVDSHLVHLVDDTHIMRSQHLCAVLPVCLVSIILLRIVRSGNIDTSLTSELADGKRYLWCRTEALEEIYLYTIGREDIGYGLSKHTSVVTAVVTYYYSQVITTRERLVDVVGKALSSHTHDILIHTIGTSTHDATQSSRTKLQVTVEGINQFGLVIVIQHCLYRTTCLFVESRRQPLLCSFLALSN